MKSSQALLQSSQATVLELWASPDLLRPPGTQFDTSWSHLETPQQHRKRPDLTGKCFDQEVTRRAFSLSRVIRKRAKLSLAALVAESVQVPEVIHFGVVFGVWWKI